MKFLFVSLGVRKNDLKFHKKIVSKQDSHGIQLETFIATYISALSHLLNSGFIFKDFL
jgi:hypothetical protein